MKIAVVLNKFCLLGHTIGVFIFFYVDPLNNIHRGHHVIHFTLECGKESVFALHENAGNLNR